MKEIKVEDLSFTDEEKETLFYLERLKQFLKPKEYQYFFNKIFKDKIKEAKRLKKSK